MRGDRFAAMEGRSRSSRQSALDGSNDGFLYGTTVAKPDFAFGRVDIDVDQSRIDFEEQKGNWVKATGDLSAEGFAQCETDLLGIDRAAVEKTEAELAVASGQVRRRDQAMQGDVLSFVPGDFKETGREVATS